MASPLAVRLASHLIESGAAQKALTEKLAEAGKRVRLAHQILEGLSFRVLPEGFFLWLDLPYTWSGPRFELAAAERRISVFCADKFSVGAGKVPNGIRVSLTGPVLIEDLRFGLQALRGIVEQPSDLSALL